MKENMSLGRRSKSSSTPKTSFPCLCFVQKFQLPLIEKIITIITTEPSLRRHSVLVRAWSGVENARDRDATRTVVNAHSSDC